MNVAELQKWEAALSQELRLRGASGREVGEALAAVREYCHDAQVHPDQAFGDPLAYARQLRPGPVPATNFARRMLPALVTVGAFLITVNLSNWATVTSPVGITVGALALAGLATLWGLATQLIAHLTTSWRPLVAGVVVFMAAWWVLVEQDRTVFEVPLWSLWLLAGSLLATGAWLTWRERREHPRSPVTGEDLSWPRSSPWLAWFYPAFTAVILGVHILRVLL